MIEYIIIIYHLSPSGTTHMSHRTIHRICPSWPPQTRFQSHILLGHMSLIFCSKLFRPMTCATFSS